MTATALSTPALAQTAGRRMTDAAMQSFSVMLRGLRGIMRQPWFIGMTVTQPVIWLILFGALFKNVALIPGFTGAAGAGTGSYLDFLMPGVLVMTALFSSGWVGMGIIEDLDRGIMDRFLVAPVHRGALIAGHQAYAAVNLLIQALIIGLLGFMMGARFGGGTLGFAVVVISALLLGASFGAISDATALVLRQRESVIGVNTAFTLPLTFLSSAFMPLNLVPDWVATIAGFNPVNWAVEAGRAAFAGTSDWVFVLSRLGGLCVLAVACMWLATRAFSSYQRSL
jgi:ABC-2 type transport system permease protein